MRIEENYSLKEFNTLNFNVKAKYFVELYSLQDVVEFSNMELFRKEPKVITGSGSNLLYLSDYNGVVVHPKLLNIEIVSKSAESVTVKVGAGVVWDHFVEWCVDRGWGGVENLSGIPGCVGASPVQNIGAYGSEVADSIVEVEYLMLSDSKLYKLQKAECNFGYRESIFKRELKGKTIITAVTFSLSLTPSFNRKYQDVALLLDKIDSPTIEDFRDAVLKIRSSKLPDPSEIGNAGSFFKNPIVAADIAEKVAKEDPSVKFFPLPSGEYKASAAALIDRCGWKGFREGTVAVHHLQPLVLLAYEGATGKELLSLADKIAKDVKKRFNIDIEPEVNIITSS